MLVCRRIPAGHCASVSHTSTNSGALKPRPTFTARKRTPPAIGWIVEAAWSDGQVDKIEGFSSEAKAVKWIAEQSETWLGSSAAE